MISVVSTSLVDNGVTLDAFRVFLASIPFNFFAWLMLIVGLYVSFGPASVQSRVASLEDRGDNWPFIERYEPRTRRATERTRKDLHEPGLRRELAGVKPHALHLVVVLLLLLVLSVLLLYRYGVRAGATTFLGALVRANAVHTLLVSAFITAIAAFLIYLARGTPFQELVYHFFNGANRLFRVVILLVLVWSLSLVSRKLGLNTFIVRELHWVPGPWIPTVFFVAGSALAYFIGSSWGTWGLLMPLGISLAVATGAPLVPTVGAVFASGTFGSLVSPLGDTTITTST